MEQAAQLEEASARIAAEGARAAAERGRMVAEIDGARKETEALRAQVLPAPLSPRPLPARQHLACSSVLRECVIMREGLTQVASCCCRVGG